MNKTKIKFLQAKTLEELETKVNEFVATDSITRSLSSKYLGIIANCHTVSVIYTENDYDRD